MGSKIVKTCKKSAIIAAPYVVTPALMSIGIPPVIAPIISGGLAGACCTIVDGTNLDNMITGCITGCISSSIKNIIPPTVSIGEEVMVKSMGGALTTHMAGGDPLKGAISAATCCLLAPNNDIIQSILNATIHNGFKGTVDGIITGCVNNVMNYTVIHYAEAVKQILNTSDNIINNINNIKNIDNDTLSIIYNTHDKLETFNCFNSDIDDQINYLRNNIYNLEKENNKYGSYNKLYDELKQNEITKQNITWCNFLEQNETIEWYPGLFNDKFPNAGNKSFDEYYPDIGLLKNSIKICNNDLKILKDSKLTLNSSIIKLQEENNIFKNRILNAQASLNLNNINDIGFSASSELSDNSSIKLSLDGTVSIEYNGYSVELGKSDIYKDGLFFGYSTKISDNTTQNNQVEYTDKTSVVDTTAMVDITKEVTISENIGKCISTISSVTTGVSYGESSTKIHINNECIKTGIKLASVSTIIAASMIYAPQTTPNIIRMLPLIGEISQLNKDLV